MKVLVVGDYHSEIHEEAIFSALKRSNIDVYRFAWHGYFKGYQNHNSKNQPRKYTIGSIYCLIQNKYLFGPIINRINKDLLSSAKRINPDLIFIYRGTHILPKTIKKLSNFGCTIFAYNNDDPFSGRPSTFYWRHYMHGLSYCNWIFSYRHKNIQDYKRLGYKNVSLLRSFYVKSKNYKMSRLSNRKYCSDVIFIGHFEPDCRDKFLKAIYDEGVDLKIYGPLWENSSYYKYFLEQQNCVSIPYLKEDYNLALNSSKIALVFLSKMNNDTYTRRCFEIVATKTFMLCEFSKDIADMFIEGEEAEYFRNEEELLAKIKYYLRKPKERLRIAENGYKRLLKDGHEIKDRASQILEVFFTLNTGT